MENISREILILKEMKSERVVRYISTMIDNNNILYIQMEYCSDNLKNILENKHKIFRRKKEEGMKKLEYYISCKIFIEILEALNYLQEQNPPILHRDIKPENILYTDKGLHTGIFFKLCDFGLAKLYERSTDNIVSNINLNNLNHINNDQSSMSISNTIGVGTNKYMAPEVWDGKYDTKADIYSLSIVGQQIFDLDNNNNNQNNR